MAHIYNGILLSHKKRRNWVICSEVDGPRVCYTEWSKSEREKQIPYANTYIWNLEKEKSGYEEPREQDGNKDADLLENGLEDMGSGKGKLGWSERVAWTYKYYQM